MRAAIIALVVLIGLFGCVRSEVCGCTCCSGRNCTAIEVGKVEIDVCSSKCNGFLCGSSFAAECPTNSFPGVNTARCADEAVPPCVNWAGTYTVDPNSCSTTTCGCCFIGEIVVTRDGVKGFVTGKSICSGGPTVYDVSGGFTLTACQARSSIFTTASTGGVLNMRLVKDATDSTKINLAYVGSEACGTDAFCSGDNCSTVSAASTIASGVSVVVFALLAAFLLLQ